MSNIIALTIVLIKNNVLAFAGKKKKGKTVSTKGSAISFISLILVCGALLGVPMIYVISNLLKNNTHLGELLLSYIVPIGGITSIVFGVFSVISIFYFSKDSEQLLPLPIKSSELLIAKFLASLVTQYLILLMFIFPLLFGVGVGIGAGVLYYVYSIVICLLMPVIPSVIISIILMLANKIFHFGKRKDLFMYIMTGLILVFSFAYGMGLELFMQGSESEEMVAILNGDFSSLIATSRWLFPFFNSATYSLNHVNDFMGFASLMTFVALNIVMMIILYFVGDKLYIKGLTVVRGSRKDKKENVEEIYKDSKGGIIRELIKKEWITIKRSPTFMLNVIIINLIFPITLGVSFIIGTTSSGLEGSMISSLVDFSNAGIFLIVLGTLNFMSSMSCSTSSSISREGSSAWMMKVIPVSLKKQLDAKVYFSIIVDLLVALIIEIPLMIMFKVPIYYFFMINIPLILIMLINNYIALILDLRKPRLDWKDEQEAVKQNFNVFLGMMVGMILDALLIVLGVLLINKSVNIYLLFSVLSVVLLCGYIGIVIFVKKNQVKLFSKVG